MRECCRSLLFVAFALALLPGGASAEQPPAARGGGLSDLVPAAGSLPGWSLVEGPEEYGPDTLYEYINGAARMYHAFGFTRLAHARYAPDSGDGAPVTLDVYHMGDAPGAYGIYTNTRSPEVEPRAWGVEGYRQGDVAAAWRGAIYVHAETEAGNAAGAAMLERLVAGVAAAAPGDASLPRMATLLPRDGFVRNSDRYVANDLLGHACLPGGMLAEYAVDGGEYLLFFSDTGSVSAANAAVAVLREYEGEDGQVLGETNDLGDGGFRALDPGLGQGSVVHRGRYVAGIWGGPSEATARRILGALLARLGDRPGGADASESRQPSQ